MSIVWKVLAEKHNVVVTVVVSRPWEKLGEKHELKDPVFAGKNLSTLPGVVTIEVNQAKDVRNLWRGLYLQITQEDAAPPQCFFPPWQV